MTIKINNNMKYISFAALTFLVFTTLLTADHVFADGSFLLQLGTFETRANAQKKWEDVRTANADVVGQLQGHVAEVMLPPDNTPSYRMQVGPLDTRKEARSLCKALEQRNVDCLLVETAFAASDLSPEMSGEASRPAASATAEAHAPAPVISAAAPEDQITTAAVTPIANDAPPAASTAAPVTRKTSSDNNEDRPGFFGRLFGSEHASGVTPEPQKTNISTTRRTNYYSSNPNDVKKPAFFRGAFRFDNNEEKTATAEKPQEPVQTASAPAVEEKPATPTEAAAPGVRGEVEVAEAIRVPVSQSEQPAAPVEYKTVKDTSDGTAPLEVIDVSGTDPYWVQISYFQNENAAHDFFIQLRNSMGDQLNDSRIRINRPFGGKNNSRTTLRVGPLTSSQTIQSVCAAASARKLGCTTIRDNSGTVRVAKNTSAPSAPAGRKHYPSPLEAVNIPAYEATPVANPVSTLEAAPSVAAPAQQPSIEISGDFAGTPATAATKVVSAGIGTQWVSLGNFSSEQEAWNHWKYLQSSVSALEKAKPAIASMFASGKASGFQLRAGPFETDVDAETACQVIVTLKNKCSVIALQ